MCNNIAMNFARGRCNTFSRLDAPVINSIGKIIRTICCSQAILAQHCFWKMIVVSTWLHSGGLFGGSGGLFGAPGELHGGYGGLFGVSGGLFGSSGGLFAASGGLH